MADGKQTSTHVMVVEDELVSARDEKSMQRQLEVADRLASLGMMAAGVAHEINNPLAVVIANADYIRGELDEIIAALRSSSGAPDPALVTRLAELSQVQSEISLAGSRIGKITSDLKAFSRPVEMTSGQADIASAIRWAVRTTAHEFRHRARLIHEVTALPPVVADETRLGQVFVNLLRNAAQAIAPGKVNENEVAIRAHADGRRIITEVHDTGPGIPPGDLQRIFEPFFTTKTGEGTGLGLSVCHGIVASVGGEIQVESEVGKGTTFRVILRAAAHRTVPPPRTLAAPIAHRRSRILLIDADEMFHRTIRRLLRDHDLVCTENARDALAILESGGRFDLILSDLMMPIMTGIELHEHLLAHDPELARRMVFVTGSALVTSKAEDFLRSIPNLRLEKPFGMPEIQSVIAQVLGDAP
jgi:signal transduction histidine kinase